MKGLGFGGGSGSSDINPSPLIHLTSPKIGPLRCLMGTNTKGGAAQMMGVFGVKGFVLTLTRLSTAAGFAMPEQVPRSKALTVFDFGLILQSV